MNWLRILLSSTWHRYFWSLSITLRSRVSNFTTLGFIKRHAMTRHGFILPNPNTRSETQHQICFPTRSLYVSTSGRTFLGSSFILPSPSHVELYNDRDNKNSTKTLPKFKNVLNKTYVRIRSTKLNYLKKSTTSLSTYIYKDSS